MTRTEESTVFELAALASSKCLVLGNGTRVVDNLNFLHLCALQLPTQRHGPGQNVTSRLVASNAIHEVWPRRGVHLGLDCWTPREVRDPESQGAWDLPR